MVTILTKLNVDTLIVSEIIMMNIGDTLEVSANIEGNGKDPLPIGWELGQSPKEGAGFKCLEVVGEDGFLGTMTFKACGYGSGSISYTIYDGERIGKTKELEILIN